MNATRAVESGSAEESIGSVLAASEDLLRIMRPFAEYACCFDPNGECQERREHVDPLGVRGVSAVNRQFQFVCFDDDVRRFQESMASFRAKATAAAQVTIEELVACSGTGIVTRLGSLIAPSPVVALRLLIDRWYRAIAGVPPFNATGARNTVAQARALARVCTEFDVDEIEGVYSCALAAQSGRLGDLRNDLSTSAVVIDAAGVAVDSREEPSRSVLQIAAAVTKQPALAKRRKRRGVPPSPANLVATMRDLSGRSDDWLREHKPIDELASRFDVVARTVRRTLDDLRGRSDSDPFSKLAIEMYDELDARANPVLHPPKKTLSIESDVDAESLRRFRERA
ncbi:MAG: hypothetical protein JNL90_12640 [Planctomycetes bacterium]|nr:hypothetical protein [Planctomycetota bacterium]